MNTSGKSPLLGKLFAKNWKRSGTYSVLVWVVLGRKGGWSISLCNLLAWKYAHAKCFCMHEQNRLHMTFKVKICPACIMLIKKVVHKSHFPNSFFFSELHYESMLPFLNYPKRSLHHQKAASLALCLQHIQYETSSGNRIKIINHVGVLTGYAILEFCIKLRFIKGNWLH